MGSGGADPPPFGSWIPLLTRHSQFRLQFARYECSDAEKFIDLQTYYDPYNVLTGDTFRHAVTLTLTFVSCDTERI